MCKQFIRDALNLLDCSANFLCSVAGVTPTSLSLFMRDLQEMSGPDLEKMMRTIRDLKEIQDDLSSVPIAFKNPKIIGALVRRKRAGLRLILLPLGVSEAVRDFEQSQSVIDAGVKS